MSASIGRRAKEENDGGASRPGSVLRVDALDRSYWECLGSMPFAITEKTPARIRDELKQHLKDGHWLLVDKQA